MLEGLGRELLGLSQSVNASSMVYCRNFVRDGIASFLVANQTMGRAITAADAENARLLLESISTGEAQRAEIQPFREALGSLQLQFARMVGHERQTSEDTDRRRGALVLCRGGRHGART